MLWRREAPARQMARGADTNVEERNHEDLKPWTALVLMEAK